MTTIKDGYKDSEIGIIPEDWETTIVDKICKVSTGSKNTQDRIEDGLYPFYVRSQNIERINSFCYDGEAILTAGDGVGTGKVYHYINGRFDVHQRVYMMTDFVENYVGKFFYYYFMNNFYSRVRRMSAKNSVDSVRKAMITEMPIPLISIEEQNKISSMLTSLDEHILNLERTIKEYELLKKGMMQKLLIEGIGHSEFKDSKLGEIPNQWEVVRLEHVAKIIAGQSPASDSYNKEEDGLPFYQGKTDFGDVYPTRSVWCSEPKKVAEKGDILISVRAPVGDVNICQESSCIGRGLGAIRVDNSMDNLYVFYFIQQHQKQLSRVAQGSTFLAINTGDLKGFLIAKPNIKEQREIGRIIYDIENRVVKLKQNKSAYETLRNGLSDALLTGRVRVI